MLRVCGARAVGGAVRRAAARGRAAGAARRPACARARCGPGCGVAAARRGGVARGVPPYENEFEYRIEKRKCDCVPLIALHASAKHTLLGEVHARVTQNVTFWHDSRGLSLL